MKRVLIGAPVKDAGRWLPRNLAAIDGLDYPTGLLSYSYVYSPSQDDTLDLLYQWLKTKTRWTLQQLEIPADNWMTRQRNHRFLTHMKPILEQYAKDHVDDGSFTYALPLDAVPSGVSHYQVWTAKQYLLKVIGGEDYYFNVDSDIIAMPPDTLRTLVEKDVDIVAPYVYVDPAPVEGNPWAGQREFYDTWCYRFAGVEWTNSHRTAIEMLDHVDPVTGLIEMESVGANPVLIKREVIDEVAYHGDEAIVGFCYQARKYGFKVYACPAVECLHAWEAI